MDKLISKHLRFSKRQIDFLNTVCKEYGVSFNEVIRRIIDEFIDYKQKKTYKTLGGE